MPSPLEPRDRPVFVDVSGRRDRRATAVAWLLAVGLLGYLALLVVSLFLPPGLQRLTLPGLGGILPGPAAQQLPDAERESLQTGSDATPPSPVASPPSSLSGTTVAPALEPAAVPALPRTTPIPAPTPRPGAVPTVTPTFPGTPVATGSPTAAPARPTQVPTQVPTAAPGRPTAGPTPSPRANGRPTDRPVPPGQVAR